MTEKAKIQQILADWKQLDSEAGKNAFLEKLKAEVDAKDGESLLAGVKAIGEMVHDLHSEVMQPASSTTPEVTQINIFPADAEERRLVEALLSRMNIRFKVA